MIGMDNSKLTIYLLLFTSISLNVLLRCYAILLESLPYTIYKIYHCLRNMAYIYNYDVL